MSKLKIFLIIFFTIIIMWLLWFWVSLALFMVKIDWSFVISENIFSEDKILSTNKLIVKSNQKAKNFSISWDCDAFWELIKTDGYTHIFDIKILKKNCEKEKINIFLKSDFNELKYVFNYIKKFDLYNKYLDFSNSDLERLLISVRNSISKIDLNIIKNSEKKIKSYRNLQELKYFQEIFVNILEKRKQKYKSPLNTEVNFTRETKVPNSLRPYRNDYTDWIHHGWDFDAKKWAEIFAIDDWIIIKVVSDFKVSEFLKIVRNWEISDIDKVKNLDILRWNQVWLKTMKWDVIFYAHLDEVYSDIKVGKFVKKWEKFWKVWATWVPEEWYDDFHLHMAIQKNPLKTEKAWTYKELDYMLWDWSFKGQTSKYVLEHYKDIFE